MERETGIGPATFSLGRRHSTDELLPLLKHYSTTKNYFETLEELAGEVEGVAGED